MVHVVPLLLLGGALVALVVFALYVRRAAAQKTSSSTSSYQRPEPGTNHSSTVELYYELKSFKPLTVQQQAVMEAWDKLNSPDDLAADELPAPGDTSPAGEVLPAQAGGALAPAAAAEAPVPAPPAEPTEQERQAREQARQLMDNPHDSPPSRSFQQQQQKKAALLDEQRRNTVNIQFERGALPNEIVPVHTLPVSTPTRRRPTLADVAD
jgi:hypothetical protein